MKFKKLLVDIGNTHFHIYDGEEVEHLPFKEAIEKYRNQSLVYISVKHQLLDEISEIKNWKNISTIMQIEGGYDTMGIDRKALCMSYNSGIFIDAGSAITVDVVEGGKYKGGFILPGIKAYLESYRSISPALDTELEKNLSLETLPVTTKEQISYGIIASIKALIQMHSDEHPLYFTGGDGAFLSLFFENSNYDEALVFKGMLKAIKDNE